MRPYPVQTDTPQSSPSVQSTTTSKRPSPTNPAQVYRDLLHQTSITYWEMRRPSPTNWPPSVQSPTTPNQYNLLRTEAIPSADEPPTSRPYPANQPNVYRALLHQTSITYWEMRPYPVQTDTPQSSPSVQSTTTSKRPSPTNPAQVYRDLLHQTSITYWEMRRPSPTNWPPSVQSPTTPNQYNLLRNE